MGGAADSCGTVSRGFQPPPAPQLATRRYERRFANVGLREALMPAGGCLMPRGVGRFPLNLREHWIPKLLSDGLTDRVLVEIVTGEDAVSFAADTRADSSAICVGGSRWDPRAIP